MYICLDCGKIFDTPARCSAETLEHFGTICKEGRETVCPHCKGSYIEAVKCDCCGDYIAGAYVKTENGWNYCSNCYRVCDILD